MKKPITIFTDGGARGNPGPAGAGAVVYGIDGEVVSEVSKFLGVQTNNWAEYEALICALTETKKHFGPTVSEEVAVKMDSELIVKQMKGEYKVKHPELKKQHEKVKELLEHFSNVSFIHVRREENKIADQLANDAMDSGA